MEGSIEGGEVRRSEFDGAQRKTAAMAEAVVFWSLGSGKRRENARNRVQGCHWFWSAREIELWGAVLLGPRRRRGGSREEVLGGLAKGGEVQREAKGGGGGAARRVGASAKQRRSWSWPGASQRGGRAAHGTGGEREQRERQRKGKRDLFAISKISRDLNVKQG